MIIDGKEVFIADPKNSEKFLVSAKSGDKLIIADLHIHSRFSRACSKDLNLQTLEKWARIKGIDLLGTGDFTHPVWLKELKENLVDKDKKGIFYTKTGFKFVLSSEISLIYTQIKGRSVHIVFLAPSFEIVDRINSYLDKKGRRDYDGRPIFKISCEQFVKDMKEISEDIELIFAHAWTPYFGVFGSESGFDSLKEALGSQFEKVYAIETGISSTPEMNLRLKELHEKTIVSFSDSHSYWPWRLGREATIFPSFSSYKELIEIIRENKIIGTIETDPAYGKYHFSGHRICNFSCSSEEAKKLNNICSVCKKPMVLGVEHRVEELADFSLKEVSDKKKTFVLLPLHELLSAILNAGMETKKVWEVYNKMIEAFGNEYNILLNVQKKDLLECAGVNEKIADIIMKNRNGKIKVKPGYDGVYGELILDDSETENSAKGKNNKQTTLF